MESSRVIRKCFQQAVRHQGETCHIWSGSRHTLSSRSRGLPTTARSFTRGFGTTTSEKSEGTPNGTNPHRAAQHAGRSNEPPRNSSSDTSTGAGNSQGGYSRSPAEDRPRRSHRYPSDTERIDLSTIPGMPSSYRPPNRPDEATAQAKLRSLLGAVAQKPSRTTSSSTSPQGQQNTSRLSRGRGARGDGEEGDAFVLPSLDAYGGGSNTSSSNIQSGGRGGLASPSGGAIAGAGAGAGPGSAAPFDIADLIAEIDKPNRSALNFLSGTSPEQQQEVLRLRSTLGRTVNVTPATGFDLTRAFRQLEIKCNQNNVRRDEIKQRFHVRRGQKTKIDRRQRWRVVFKEGFLAECARVRRMRAQGW